MEEPTIKKTITGYVIKHRCLCGEALVNKLSEAGKVDLCPSCQRQFKVPLAEQAKQLEVRRAKEKAAKLAEKEKRKKDQRERAHNKVKEGEEVVAEIPSVSSTPFYMQPSAKPRTAAASPRFTGIDVDDSALRSLVDAAASWVSLLAYLILILAVLSQVVLVIGLVVSLVTGGINEFWLRLLLFALATLALQLVYYFTKVGLGMVAAGLLIERNTRS